MIRLVALAAALAVAGCEQPRAIKGADGDTVTLAQFNRLQTGMTKDQVETILGSPGVEQSSNELAGIRTEMRAWNGNTFGGNMNVMFQDGKLVQKAQFGLE